MATKKTKKSDKVFYVVLNGAVPVNYESYETEDEAVEYAANCLDGRTGHTSLNIAKAYKRIKKQTPAHDVLDLIEDEVTA